MSDKISTVLIVTLSDRASAGEYEDMSGMVANQIIKDFSKENELFLKIQRKIIPDDADKLADILKTAVKEKIDIVFTLGGTGIGPRDITPEVVSPICDKLISGIMENIRLKFATNNPNTLLSRSIAGIAGNTQVYTLPGSVKAVKEYLSEIVKTLEHAFCMLHNIDVH